MACTARVQLIYSGEWVGVTKWWLRRSWFSLVAARSTAARKGSTWCGGPAGNLSEEAPAVTCRCPAPLDNDNDSGMFFCLGDDNIVF